MAAGARKPPKSERYWQLVSALEHQWSSDLTCCLHAFFQGGSKAARAPPRLLPPLNSKKPFLRMCIVLYTLLNDDRVQGVVRCKL